MYQQSKQEIPMKKVERDRYVKANKKEKNIYLISQKNSKITEV